MVDVDEQEIAHRFLALIQTFRTTSIGWHPGGYINPSDGSWAPSLGELVGQYRPVPPKRLPGPAEGFPGAEWVRVGFAFPAYASSSELQTPTRFQEGGADYLRIVLPIFGSVLIYDPHDEDVELLTKKSLRRLAVGHAPRWSVSAIRCGR